MSDQEECPGVDAVCPLGVVMPDGSMPVVRHARDHSFQMGSLRPLEEGKPINGAIVRVEDVKPGQWCQMKPVLKVEDRMGPAMVNSQEYTDGWTSIFGHQTYGEA